MAQLVIAAAGSALGGQLLGTGIVALGMTGNAIGWTLGSIVGSMFGPTQKSQGPRLNDLTVGSSSYGTPIPYAIGTPRLAGQIVWASDKREIATSTEQGKGGGGSKYTSFTYDVDLLIMLTDNEIVGVRRIWRDGELVWTAAHDADVASLQSSQATSHWNRLTVYTGSASQLPDPTYEAAVGVGNAPAYRGRGCVFIEGMHLGSSGQISNLTFEVVTAGTVHAPGGSLTRLQVDFVGATSADTSYYAIGSGTNDEVTVVDGSASALFDSNANSKSLVYSDVGISQISDDAPLTYEIFWKATLDTPSPQSPGDVIKFAQFTTHLNGIDFYIRGVPNDTDILIVQSGYTTVTVTAGHAYGSQNHLALVNRSTGVMDIYLNGVRVVTGRNDNTTLAGLGTMQLGGIGRGDTRITYYGARVRREEVYPDTGTFTPPTSPADWGPAYATYSTIEPIDVTLQDAAEQICDRVGMPAGKYDASALVAITKPVRSMLITPMSARAALEVLMSTHFFEATGSPIKFIPRGGASAVTIPFEDLGTFSGQSDKYDPLPLTLSNELELPAQIALSYSDVDADYQAATQYSDRLLTGMKSTSVVQVPVGLTASEAKAIAVAMHVDQLVALLRTKIVVDLAYTKYVPGDVAVVTGEDGSTYRMRLLQRLDTGGAIAFECALDDASALAQAGVTSATGGSQTVVQGVRDTTLMLLDIPLLRDTENKPCHLFAVKSAARPWRGTAVYQSADDVTFDLELTVAEEAVIGSCTTTLGNFAGIGWDHGNSVTVNVGDGTLSSYTADAIAAGAAPGYLFGNEVAYARTATLVAPGVYTLTNLLRGRRGTAWAISGHGSSERFAVLSTAGVRVVDLATSELGRALYYKAVSAGQSAADVDSQGITPLGVNLKPFAGRFPRATRDASNTTVQWCRGTRLSTRFLGPLLPSAPLGEAVEKYEVDAYSDGTFTGTPTTTTVYSPSITISGIGAKHLKIYQMSETVGRGYPLTVSI